MVWDYRIVVKDNIYGVHECYYNKKGESIAISKYKIILVGETLSELRLDFKLVGKAFEKPVLNYEDFD